MKKSKQNRILLDAQRNRYDHRFGEVKQTGPKFSIASFYKEPVEFCVQLFRSGKGLADSIYITRLTFTDPSCPHYRPIERWDAEAFYRCVIRYIKSS